MYLNLKPADQQCVSGEGMESIGNSSPVFWRRQVYTEGSDGLIWLDIAELNLGAGAPWQKCNALS
jgi:hypothetical protein